MKSFYQFFCESVLDPKQKTLDKTLFDDIETENPKLSQIARNQILFGAKEFQSYLGEPKHIYLVGSILGKNYTDTTDLDVHILVDLSEKDVDFDTVNSYRKEIGDKNVIGTKHPITYFPVYLKDEKYKDYENLKNYDNVYDVVEEKWVKKTSLDGVNLSKELDKHSKDLKKFDFALMKLRRDLMDYIAIVSNNSMNDNIDQNIPKDEQKKLEKQKKLVVSDVDELEAIGEKIHDSRLTAYNKTTSKVKKPKGKSSGNIAWKLYERYDYVDLYKHLKKALENELDFDLDTAKSLLEIIRDFV